MLWQSWAGVPGSGGVSSRTSIVDTGSGVCTGTSGVLHGSAKPLNGSRGPGQQVICSQLYGHKSTSRRHSTVTFVDQVDSTAASNLESSMDVNKHRIR